jgi:hypothetical protein
VDWRTGERVWNCELSSIDSALLTLGALAAGEYWPNTAVHRLAEEIAARMDWRWMQTDGGAKPLELAPSMGWDPKKGFLKSRWAGYSEAAFLYFLALGTPGEHALPRASWDAWTFKPTRVEGQTVFGGPSPIFMAQMTAGFFDLRGMRDRRERDWWTAWKNAHLADQAYCARTTRNKTYAAGFWAINASDQPTGYGADSPMDGANTGTVSPTGMLAGILFTPDRAKQSQRDLWLLNVKRQAAASTNTGTAQSDAPNSKLETGNSEPKTLNRELGTLNSIWGRYGYCNAFNIDKNWYDPDVIGIDLGMMLLATENARSGLIWGLMKHSGFVQRGLTAAGFHSVTK